MTRTAPLPPLAFLLALGLSAPVLAASAPEPVPAAVSGTSAGARRTLRPDDIFSLRDVDDPSVSPDGAWVAFTVQTLDRAKDSADSDVYMVPTAGGETVRLTTGGSGEKDPAWSPDGRWLAFLSDRGGPGQKTEDDVKTQVWLLDRRGGEAFRLTGYKASVSALAWSPDGKRLALVVGDPDPDEAEEAEKKASGGDGKEKAPKPIVVRRLQFKRDGEGYLNDQREHLHVFDLASRKTVQVTSGAYDDSEPAWSPDGQWIAFTSNRTENPDSNQNTDVFVVAAGGGEPRRLTTTPSSDSGPSWSPDGRSIAYLQGCDPADLWYGPTTVAVVPSAGGAPRVLTAAVDRNAERARFSLDGQWIYFLLEDGGNRHLARVPAVGGKLGRVVAGERDVQKFDLGPGGQIAVLETSPQQPAEISAVTDGGDLRRLTRVNDAFLAGIRLAKVERFKVKSADGTAVDAFLTLPPDARPGERLPTVLRIHGGPASQYSTEFEIEWQMLAAHGFAVVAANPRGSTGYGRDFSRVLWADWGNKDYEDVMAAVDEAVRRGVADPERLGVGGWSYGGILTDYVITKTGRFKAAISGASEVNYLADYGTDHYQYEWETELGLPWKNTDLWLRLSPFFQVEKVTTPTLILCGQEDWNVPLINSEQLYQALRRLGKETELVIYPGQGHAIRRPSYQQDRFERYLAWYGRYLKPASAPARAPEVAEPAPLGQRSH